MAKSPTVLEPLRMDPVPMSVGEGGLLFLVGSALVGAGYIAGRMHGRISRMREEILEKAQQNPRQQYRDSNRNRPNRNNNPDQEPN